MSIPMHVWLPDDTRQWWCKKCRRFTWWELRKTDGGEDERCAACAS